MDNTVLGAIGVSGRQQSGFGMSAQDGLVRCGEPITFVELRARGGGKPADGYTKKCRNLVTLESHSSFRADSELFG